MKQTSFVLLPLLLVSPAVALDDQHEKHAPEVVLIQGATVWTQSSKGVLEDADVLIRDGKIDRVGKGLRAPGGAETVDGSGKHVTPGLIDCHSHTAIRGGVNEGSNNVTAEVRIIDVIDPDNVNIYRQLAGGLTAAHLLHGSANSIGGQDAVIKLRWHARSAEELLISDSWPGVKFALGENPKRSNFRRPGRPQRYPATRMGVMESIRERFVAARDYMREWQTYDALPASKQQHTEPPRRDLQLEAIAEILRGERRIHSHSYRQDEILALVRLCDEFGITVATFQHVLEGYKVADELARHGAGASTFSDWWAYKLEAYDAIPYNGALMHDRGVSVTFNSDSSELARRMNLEAAKAVKWGNVDEAAALDFVTLNAAKQLGIDHRTGSLEKGKDADVVIWSGHPLSVFSIVEETWVDGVREFDRETDLAARAGIVERRAELIERVRKGRSSKDDDDAQDEDDAEDEAATPEEEPEAQTAPGDVEKVARVAPAYTDRLAELAGRVSIVHATVHTVSGGVIDDGTVSFENGVIVEVGAGLAPLRAAEVVDATGKHVWPGLIDLNTSVGLTEINSVAGSVDVAETGTVNPNASTAIAVNPASELIGVTRANGLTHVLAVPSGGLVSGTSALIRLDGWTWEDLAAVRHAGLHVRWPSFGGGRRFFGPQRSDEDLKREREERFKEIRRLFDDARAYRKAREADGKGGAPTDVDGRLEAMLPVLAGEVPVILHADEIRQIKSAVAWAEEEGLPFILAGAGDVWRVADMLAEKRIPVILTGVLSLPRREDEPYDVRYTEASVLHEAGVTFAIATSGGTFAAAMVRTLPYHAAMAAAFGLPRQAALEALTLGAARVLGLDDRLGSIEKGKSASLIVTDGDPLEIRTRVERVFVDGRPIDPDDNKHHRLYERYRSRPTVAAGSRP